MTQTVENKILSRIYGNKRGFVFTPAVFSDSGSYNAVLGILKILCDKGQIRRLARGLYDYPERHPRLGVLSPTPERIAQALAGKEGLRIQTTGAYAANALGLRVQLTSKSVF